MEKEHSATDRTYCFSTYVRCFHRSSFLIPRYEVNSLVVMHAEQMHYLQESPTLRGELPLRTRLKRSFRDSPEERVGKLP